MIPNRTIIGNRGSGKSVALEGMLCEIAREASVLLLDWPGTLADRMTGRMIERGLEGKLIVDKARWTDRMPQWAFRPEPRSTDPLMRQMEAEAADEMLLSACFARRYEKDGSLAPSTYRAARAAIRVFFGIPAAIRPPIDRITRLFRAKDPLGQWMLRETAERDAAHVFLDAAKLAVRAPTQWDGLVGAGGRLLDVLASPAIWTRHGASLDWKTVLRERKHVYLGMEGLAPTTATTLAVLAYAPAIQAAKALFEETGTASPLVVVLEEAGALGLVTPLILTAMQAYRKYGVSVWVVSQTVEDFRDAATREQLLAMSEHHWHQMTAGVERAAADCAQPTYDPNRVLHTKERPVVHRYAEVASRTVQVDARGRTRSTSRGTAFRPIVGVQVEETFDTPANHEAELRRQLATLGVGERIVRGLDGTVRRETVPLPPDPWGPFAEEEITLNGTTQSLARHRLDAALARIRQNSVYSPPPVWTPPPSPARSAPARTPTPPTGVGPRGMRGS